jgi:hypothetical protein
MAILNETQGDERVPTGERFYEKTLHKGARRLPAQILVLFYDRGGTHLFARTRGRST